MWMAEGGAGDGGDDVTELGAFGLEELEAGGDGSEEAADGDAGAAGAADGPLLDDALVAGEDLAAGLALGGDGSQREFGHGGDAGEGLAAEAESLDAGEVVDGAELAGAVAFDGEGDLVGRDAGAVVGDFNQGLAALFDGDIDAAGAGIEGVVEELADDGGGAFDDLAGGDFAADLRREAPDAHERRVRCSS